MTKQMAGKAEYTEKERMAGKMKSCNRQIQSWIWKKGHSFECQSDGRTGKGIDVDWPKWFR